MPTVSTEQAKMCAISSVQKQTLSMSTVQPVNVFSHRVHYEPRRDSQQSEDRLISPNSIVFVPGVVEHYELERDSLSLAKMTNGSKQKLMNTDESEDNSSMEEVQVIR